MNPTRSLVLALAVSASLLASPPVINSFTADTPSAPLDSTLTLRWDVNRGGDAATTITLVETGTDLSSPTLIGQGVQPASLLTLVPRASTGWKVHSDEAAPPSDWNTAAFDDATWAEPGVAPIGYGETDNSIPTVVTPPNNHRKPYYFRRSFDLTQAEVDGFLQYALEMIRDDGMIVYLNGQEVARANLSPGVPTHDTFASATVDTNEGAFYRYPIDKSKVAVGRNTLAIALFQRNATSSDLRFDVGFFGFQVTRPATVVPAGSSWKYNAYAPITDTSWTQPGFNDSAWGAGAAPLGLRDTNPGTLLSYGADANAKPLAHHFRRKFTVGSAAAVQELRLWVRYGDGAAVYLNGVRVDLPATDTTTADFLGLPRTPVTATTVATADHDGSGWGNADANLLPRLVMTRATHPEVFATLVDGENLLAASVHPVSATDADLRFDLRLEENLSADAALPAIGTLLPEFSTWSYLDGGAVPTPDWNSAAYDDSVWKSGPGNFAYGFPTYLPATALPYSAIGNTFDNKINTYYFRRTFTLAQADYDAMLTGRANLRVDDGFALYLNGVEISRSANLPAGTLTQTTFTTGSRGDIPQATTDTVTLPKSAFVVGENTLALEVHQSDAASTDLWFDLALERLSAAASPVYTLRASNTEGTVEKTFSPTLEAHDFSLPSFLGTSVATANSWSTTMWTDGFGTVATADKDYQILPSYCTVMNTSSSVPTFPGRSLIIHPGSALAILHSDTVGDLRLAGGRLWNSSTTAVTPTLAGNLSVLKESVLDGGSYGYALNMPLSGTGRLRVFSSPTVTGVIGNVTLSAASPAFAGSFHLVQGRLNVGGTAVLHNAPVILDNGNFAPSAPLVSTGSLVISNRFGTALVTLDQPVTFATVTLPSGSAVPPGTYTVAQLPAEAAPFFTGASTLTVVSGLVDADHDGLDDAWEQTNFGTTAALATDDPDHDGINNLGEYIAGTNPNDAASVFRLQPASVSGTNVLFSLPTKVGSTYKLQSSANLGVTAAWTDVPGATVTGDGTVKPLSVPAGAATKLFIRAVVSR